MGCGLGCESAEVLGKDKCQGSGRAGATQSFLCRENIQPLRLNFFLEGFVLLSLGYSIWLELSRSDFLGMAQSSEPWKMESYCGYYSPLSDVESYYWMFATFRDSIFNVVAHLEMKNM